MKKKWYNFYTNIVGTIPLKVNASFGFFFGATNWSIYNNIINLMNFTRYKWDINMNNKMLSWRLIHFFFSYRNLRFCVKSHQNRGYATSKALNFLFITFSLGFLNMFLSSLKYCLQYKTWRHNSLLFSQWNFQCQNNSFWKYHYC